MCDAHQCLRCMYSAGVRHGTQHRRRHRVGDGLAHAGGPKRLFPQKGMLLQATLGDATKAMPIDTNPYRYTKTLPTNTNISPPSATVDPDVLGVSQPRPRRRQRHGGAALQLCAGPQAPDAQRGLCRMSCGLALKVAI